jgi:hypothetical protein
LSDSGTRTRLPNIITAKENNNFASGKKLELSLFDLKMCSQIDGNAFGMC